MSKDIRKILMNEIDELRSGNFDIKKSRTIVKAAAQVIYADRLEMEQQVHELKMMKFVGKGK